MKGVKSPFHQKVKTNFKKIFTQGGIFRLLREFTLQWKEKTNLSPQRKEVVKGGFIKFYRDFQDWHWYSDANVLQLMFSKLNIIRMYRNKIFHYGSLLTDSNTPPARMHNLIYKMIREMNAQKLLKQLKTIDRFNEKYQKGKELNYLKQ